METMRKKWSLIAVIGLSAIAAQAEERKIPVAECVFREATKAGELECTALANICLGAGPSVDAPAPAPIPAPECRELLRVSCNEERVFEGPWKPGSQENPVRYFIVGLNGEREALKISIQPDQERGNPSKLEVGAREIHGRCELKLPEFSWKVGSGSSQN